MTQVHPQVEGRVIDAREYEERKMVSFVDIFQSLLMRDKMLGTERDIYKRLGRERGGG